eukprot:4264900-Amphidinium_carterae.1
MRVPPAVVVLSAGDEDGKLNIYDMGSFDHDVLPGNKARSQQLFCFRARTHLSLLQHREHVKCGRVRLRQWRILY